MSQNIRHTEANFLLCVDTAEKICTNDALEYINTHANIPEFYFFVIFLLVFFYQLKYGGRDPPLLQMNEKPCKQNAVLEVTSENKRNEPLCKLKVKRCKQKATSK